MLLETVLPLLRVRLPERDALDPFALFPERPAEIWLEVGFGGGEHLAAQAAANPHVGFIGCEVFENGVAKLLAEIERQKLRNVRVFDDDARRLIDSLPDGVLGRVFVLFPDPWPKVRHHKRRFVQSAMLTLLARKMKDGAELRLATDDVGYLRWMLERAPIHPDFDWFARRAADWRVRPEDWPPTRYELKAVAAGRAPAFLRLRRRPRPAIRLTFSQR